VLIKRSSQVATGAINSGDLADDRGVSLRDLTPETRRAIFGAGGAAPGAAGPRGAQGPVGAKGETGPQGADGPRGPRGEALAFAHVPAEIPATGRPTDGTSRGVVAIRRVTGPLGHVYCFDLEVPAVNAVAVNDYADAIQADFVYPPYVAMPSTQGGYDAITADCPADARDAAVYFGDDPDPRGTAFFVVFN
jgi:hypothetical protein